MNRVEAKVKDIRSVDSLYVVTFKCCIGQVRMVSLDLDRQLQEGDIVTLGVNFTSVAVAKNFRGALSFTNQLPAKISGIEHGELLSVVELACGEAVLESLLLTDSVTRLELKPEDNVTMIIKANDIYLLGREK